MRITIKGVAKCGILACFLYMQWYRWVFGERAIILYGTAGIAVACMAIDLLFLSNDERFFFPYGCINNVVMCGYSILVGLFVAVSSEVLLNTTKTFLSFSIICLVFCYISSNGDFDWIISGFIASAMICALWTLFFGYYLRGYGMVLSASNNPHTLGMVMNLGIFGLAYRCKRNVKSLLVHLLIAVFFVFIIIQCGSRKCLIAALLILIPWLYISFRHIYINGTIGERRAIVLFYLVIIALGVTYYLYQYVGSVSYERILDIEESKANQSRIHYYQLGLEYFADSPVFGIGLGQFAVRNPNGAYSHSTIAEAFASWGIIGGFLYIIPMLVAACRSFRIALQTGDYHAVIITAMCVEEIFMAFLQIFFYSLQHMMTWSLIFIFVQMHSENKSMDVRRCKYVKV